MTRKARNKFIHALNGNTVDSKGRTGFATIDDSFADLMSHHTVEVTAEGKPVRVEPYAYVDE